MYLQLALSTLILKRSDCFVMEKSISIFRKKLWSVSMTVTGMQKYRQKSKAILKGCL